MTANGTPTIVDADGHIVESVEEMAEFLDPPIRDTALGTGGIGTIIELSRRSLFGTLDGLHFAKVDSGDNATARRERINASENRMGSAQDWQALLDKSRMEQTVVYTTEGLQVGKLRNKDYVVGLCRGYNDYVANCYQRYDGRIHPIALIPMQDPARAALELRRAVKDLGLLGAMLPSTGLDLHLGHEYYWPVYQEASDLGCILAVHGGSNVGIGIDSFNDLTPSGIVHHPVPLLYAFVSFIYDRVFDRFPDMRVAFLEGGCAWVALGIWTGSSGPPSFPERPLARRKSISPAVRFSSAARALTRLSPTWRAESGSSPSPIRLTTRMRSTSNPRWTRLKRRLKTTRFLTSRKSRSSGATPSGSMASNHTAQQGGS